MRIFYLQWPQLRIFGGALEVQNDATRWVGNERYGTEKFIKYYVISIY
jgi:hypothetical protein